MAEATAPNTAAMACPTIVDDRPVGPSTEKCERSMAKNRSRYGRRADASSESDNSSAWFAFGVVLGGTAGLAWRWLNRLLPDQPTPPEPRPPAAVEKRLARPPRQAPQAREQPTAQVVGEPAPGQADEVRTVAPPPGPERRMPARRAPAPSPVEPTADEPSDLSNPPVPSHVENLFPVDVPAPAEPQAPANVAPPLDFLDIPAPVGEILAAAPSIDGGSTAGDAAQPAKPPTSPAPVREKMDEQLAATLLLADLRDAFRRHEVDRLTSAQLVSELSAMSSRPWASWRDDGSPITAHALSRLLRRFGVRPGMHRFGDRIERGYVAADVEAAWQLHGGA